MMKHKWIYITLLFIGMCCAEIEAQSFWFGPKGGATLGIQRWNNFERQPLFAGHGAFFIETVDEDKTLGSLYAQLGLHQRGSATRSFINSWDNVLVPGLRFVFNNISLQVGAKKFMNDKFYYLIGVRGEYTVSTNLEELNERFVSPSFPQPESVRPLVAGITGGAGYQFEISELYGAGIEFTVNPDFYNNYYTPAIPNIISPITGNSITLPETSIRNTTLEVTLVLRFLRKVEYY